MASPFSSKGPQKVLIPPGILSADENTILDIPGADEGMFVATKPRSQRPCPRARSESRPDSQQPQPYLTVGPEPEELESREQENLQQDLKEFQFARRKLLYDVLTLQMTKLKPNVKKLLQKR